MKIYKIYACAFGSFWETDVDCPYGWYGSGVYDVEYECYQEASFEVSALTLKTALKLVYEKFEKYQGVEWSYSVHAVYYNPDAVEVKDDPEDGISEEVYDWEYGDPVNGTDIPNEYSKEID